MYGLIIITLLICTARFFIAPSPLSAVGSYQAVAHLFVGGLIGATILAWQVTKQWHELEEHVNNQGRVSPHWAAKKAFAMRSIGRNLFYLAAAMSAVEAIAFVIGKLK